MKQWFSLLSILCTMYVHTRFYYSLYNKYWYTRCYTLRFVYIPQWFFNCAPPSTIGQRFSTFLHSRAPRPFIKAPCTLSPPRPHYKIHNGLFCFLLKYPLLSPFFLPRIPPLVEKRCPIELRESNLGTPRNWIF